MQTAGEDRRHVLDARKRSYDNTANGFNFTIRKINLMFVFIVVVWMFFLINT